MGTGGRTAVAAMAALLWAAPARAAVSAQEAARLGQDLTPMGAQAAGNAAGTIPAWTGGLKGPVAGFSPGGHYPDPFPDDQPLYTIDGSNLDQHRDQLSEGQAALLKKYPTWKLRVFPTRRSAAYPQRHYDETRANATQAVLAPGGNGVSGTQGGVPFPIPKDGTEAIWNHLLHYRGDTYAMDWSQASVTRGGDYTLVRFQYEYDFHYGSLRKADAEREDNKLLNFLQVVTAPARLAGQVILVHEFVDQVRQPRQAWTYNPGQRRVRLAPTVSYDNPGTASDGLRTNDDFNMFNGATDRYEWKLLGKREMVIPYNSYALVSPAVRYKDLLKPGHVDPELCRYELHRVWGVEAKLKPGTSHLYHRRVFYIDEDSWIVAVTDKYDSRGELWRTSETHPTNFYDFPMQYLTTEVHTDLQSGRYIAMGLRNEEPRLYRPTQPAAARFTPAGLRGLGTR